MPDHGDGYTQPAAALTSAVFGRDVNGESSGALTGDDVLNDITLYWLTNTGVSAARFYCESHIHFTAAVDVSVPAAISVFPRENDQAPRSWTERAYHFLSGREIVTSRTPCESSTLISGIVTLLLICVAPQADEPS